MFLIVYNNLHKRGWPFGRVIEWDFKEIKIMKIIDKSLKIISLIMAIGLLSNCSTAISGSGFFGEYEGKYSGETSAGEKVTASMKLFGAVLDTEKISIEEENLLPLMDPDGHARATPTVKPLLALSP